jgi:surface antigen
MNRLGLIVVLGVASVTLAGCLGNGPKQDAGTLFGAVTGGLVGSAVGNGNLGAAAAGAVIGGFIGNEIGAGLDEADRRMAADAQYRALEYGRTGAPVTWRGRRGNHGDVVAGSAYRVNDYNCRDYTTTIYIDGRPETARGTACRQPDGSWRTVS